MPEIAKECLAVSQELSALIDRELAAAREAEVRAHVADCAACADRLQELCNADLALVAIGAPVVADDLRARIDARLAASASSDRASQRPRRTPPPARRRGLALGIAGGLAAAVMLALLFGLPREPIAPGSDSLPPVSQLSALEELPDEDAALLLEFDAVADLDLIANLDLLEAMVDLGAPDGA